jgi:hypothetical protein
MRNHVLLAGGVSLPSAAQNVILPVMNLLSQTAAPIVVILHISMNGKDFYRATQLRHFSEMVRCRFGCIL